MPAEIASLVHCPDCGYRVTESTEGRCPECSYEWDAEAIIRPYWLNRYSHRTTNRRFLPYLVSWPIILAVYAAIIGFITKDWSALGLLALVAALITVPIVIGPLFPTWYPLRNMLLISFNSAGITCWTHRSSEPTTLPWSAIREVRVESAGGRFAVLIDCGGKPPVVLRHVVIGATRDEARAIEDYAVSRCRPVTG